MLPIGQDDRPGSFVDRVVDGNDGRNGRGRGRMVLAEQRVVELFFRGIHPVLGLRG